MTKIIIFVIIIECKKMSSIIDQIISKLEEWKEQHPDSIMSANHHFLGRDYPEDFDLKDYVKIALKAAKEDIKSYPEFYSYCQNMVEYQKLINYLEDSESNYNNDYEEKHYSDGDIDIIINVSKLYYHYYFTYRFNSDKGNFEGIKVECREIMGITFGSVHKRKPDNWEKDLNGEDMNAQDILEELTDMTSNE